MKTVYQNGEVYIVMDDLERKTIIDNIGEDEFKKALNEADIQTLKNGLKGKKPKRKFNTSENDIFFSDKWNGGMWHYNPK